MATSSTWAVGTEDTSARASSNGQTAGYVYYLPSFGTVSSQPAVSTTAQMVATVINAARAEHGLPALAVDIGLAVAAQVHAEDMATRNYFAHDTLDGPTFGERLRRYYPGARIGECLAAGMETPESAVDAWMESPGHRAILLTPEYTEVGVGYAQGGEYGSYYVADFGSEN